jgi:hypothetical protein
MSTMVRGPRVAGSAHTGDAGGAHLRVPWSTVLPLAVVAAFGNGFWLVSIREAVGAIERTQGPFTVWLEEFALLLPLYVFAVLAALTLALRWFGPGPHRARTVVLTLLLVVIATTLAAIAVQATSAVYDYRLQSTHLATMVSHGTCDALCVADRQQSALLLQTKALGLNGCAMLMSNLVLLGLVVAFRGGRLKLATPRPNRERRSRLGTARVARFDDLELFLLVALLGSAAIHATVVRERLAQWPAAGIALLLLTIAEVDAALLFLLRLRSVHYLGAAVVSAGPLLVWLSSHSAGLPFGPGAGIVQQVGLTDAAAALLEAATLAVAVAALRSRRPRVSGQAQHPAWLAVAGVVAVSVVGVAVGLGALGGAAAPPQQHPGHHATV